MTSIGIVGGTGRQGFALAKRLLELNYYIVIGSRSSEKGAMKAKELNSDLVSGGSNQDAAKCDIIVLAIPFDQVQLLLTPFLNYLPGKIIMDLTVQLVKGKYPSVEKTNDMSSYEYIRELFPESNVVSLLKTISFIDLEGDAPIHQVDFQMTTSDEAYNFTSNLVKHFGLTPVRVRGKFHAHTIERMVALAFQLNKEYPGSHIGFQLTNLKLE